MPSKTRKPVTPPVVTVRKKPKKQDTSLVARKPETKSSPVQQPQAAPPRPSATSPVPQSPPQAEPILNQAPQPEVSPSPSAEHAIALAVESAPSSTPINRRQRDVQARKDLLAVFRAHWPVAFPRDFRQLKPLALRIHEDLAAALPDTPPALIRQTIALFQRWSGAGYWLAIDKGGPRYDLEGNPRGEVTPEEQARARQELAAIHERKKAKRQAARVPEGAQLNVTPAAVPPR
jgi:ProP effector